MVEILVGGRKPEDILRERRERLIRDGLQRPVEDEEASPPAVAYGGVEIQISVQRNAGGGKSHFSYDKSLELLRRNGFERHPLPSEMFGIWNQRFFGTLPPRLDPLLDDMLSDGSEWTDLAMKVYRSDGWRVNFYQLPEVQSHTDRRGYTRHRFAAPLGKAIESFHMGGYISARRGTVLLEELSQRNHNLIRFLYGRSYTLLPQQVQERGGLYIPKGPEPRILIRGGSDHHPFQYHATLTGMAASRGVREKKGGTP